MDKQPTLNERVAFALDAMERELARLTKLTFTQPENVRAEADYEALSYLAAGLQDSCFDSETLLRDVLKRLAVSTLQRTATDFTPNEDTMEIPASYYLAMAYKRAHALVSNLLKELPNEEED